ncbi:MAG TPA: tetratricopeptide repeat protein [Verrucomicrobiae bacterium]|nr:tetratricopeptide repeat protein [Verrucomicrobiae bacterium]
MLEALGRSEVRLVFASVAPECVNFPWELLPGRNGGFLVADGRVAIRRRTRPEALAVASELVAPPLRLLFCACAPIDLPKLDYEKEEEAILRIADRLGGKVHLDIGEAGTFEELKDLVSELRPHIVHLSGHGALDKGVGFFAFESERGGNDSREGREVAERVFADRGVRMVFVSGCESAQAGVAGFCQSLTVDGHVPLALGWGASIADDRAIDFAATLYHEVAAGRPVDRAIAAARRDLFEHGRVRFGSAELLDASFALPQLYAADDSDQLVDEGRPMERLARPGVHYELLGDNIRGLREGFVGRRRVLQRTRPLLRAGEKTVVLLTGIGGAGKSTLATRLANRCKQDGYRIVAVQARREESAQFCLRLTGELAAACQRLGREADERMLRDGQRPMTDRLRLAVEILNEAKVLLVLDNLEALMPQPPAPPRWDSEDFAQFAREVTSRLTQEGRAILTCRYVPEGLDLTQPNVAHEPLPDFTEADFFKYLRRHDKVATRMETGELKRELLTLFYRKLGATPRFVEQASAVLGTADPDGLREQLEGVAEPGLGVGGDELWELQQQYFSDLFLPQLYDALTPAFRVALSRLALVEIPLPVDGVARVVAMKDDDVREALEAWLALGLLQRFGEEDEVPLYAVYPLQREFLTGEGKLDQGQAKESHVAAAAFFRACYETDREKELRLPVGLELMACFRHGRAGDEKECWRWAAELVANGLQRRAEYRSVLEFLEPLLEEDRDHRLLCATADALQSLGEWRQARRRYEEALPVQNSNGDRAGEASTWHQLATIDVYEGNYAAAREKFGQALEMRQAIGDRAGEAGTWHNLATIDLREGNYAAAREKFGKSLAIEQAIGNRAGEASTWHQLATIDVYEGNYAAAREKCGKALEMLRAIGDRAGEASTWHQLATIDLREGNYAAAREKFGKALEMLQAIGDRAGEASTLYQIGFVAWDRERKQVGIRLVALCFAIESSIGSGGVKETVPTLGGMAGDLGLDEAGAKAVLQEAVEQYRRDRGAELVRQAFEGL